MKRLCVFLACLVLVGINLVQAQTVRITGTVTSSEDGLPIPGVSITVKGTTTGIFTNADGKYELPVPASATTLSFTFVGMKAQDVEIGGRAVIDVALQPESLQVEEVIITSAYGIKRTPKGSVSLSQVVTGDKLNEVRQSDVSSALAGKVSGIQVRSQSGAKLGSSGTIRLRGEGGFSTGQGVLYVVDGTVMSTASYDPMNPTSNNSTSSNSNEINMDNVEDINVLSGPAAAAILGPQGANGAIIITTKKGKANQKGVGIDFSTGIVASKVYILPQYQNSYAGGANQDLTKFTWNSSLPVEWKSLDGKFYHDYSDDASWGPRMNGQEYIPWYAWYDGTKYTGQTAKLVPQPTNSRDFYSTGVTKNTSIAFSKASEDMNIRATYGNLSIKGLIPTSSLNKHTFTLKTSYKLSKKLTVAANVNFNTTLTKGEFDDLYSNQTSGSFNQWFHRDLDMGIMKELKDLRTKDGIWASWNHNNPGTYDAASPKNFYAGNFWYNFYKWFDLIDIPQRDDRLFGDVSVSYEIIKDLSAKLTYRRQEYNSWAEQKYSTDLRESGTQTTGNSPQAKGFYQTQNQYVNTDNYESLINYSKSFSNFKINANAGSDFKSSINKFNSAQTVDGFNISNLYSISNSFSKPNIVNVRTKEKANAIFLRGDVGYKDYLFAEFTLRKDWFSTLPPDNNAISSKSFGASLIFSDLLKLSFLNFGKVRVSWGEIPKAINIFDYPGTAYAVNQYTFNTDFLMGVPDVKVDKNIRGAKNVQKELGLELRFFDSKIGLSTTYWDGSEKDIPYNITVPGFHGYNALLANTGEIKKTGLDLALNIRPIANDNYRWDITATLGYLIDNKIIKIAPGITQFAVENIWRSNSPGLVHAEGQQWGQLYGGGKTMVNGKYLLDKNGYNVSNPNTFFGNVLPKVTGGIQNSVKFLKDFTFTMNIDYQFGGKFFSLSDMWGTFSGLTEKTAVLNDKGIPVRDAVADGGGVHVVGIIDLADYGTNANATPIYQDVDKYIEGQDYFHSLYNNQVYDDFVHDLTFVKVRELSLAYNIPVKKLKLMSFIQGATISIVSTNPWLIYTKDKDFDPSEISGVSGEAGQMPGVRTFGANLKISF